MLSRVAVQPFLEASQILSGPLAGGLRETFNIDRETYDFVYSETTGYLITYFVNRYRLSNNPADLERARLAAQFIIDHLDKGRIPFSYSLTEGIPDQRAFTFDNAICLGGLLDLYRIDPVVTYLAAAKTMAAWILAMVGDNHNFRAYEKLPTGEINHPGTNFADDGSCIHLKETISLFKMSTVDATLCPSSRAVNILNKNADFQREDGGFTVDRNGSRVFSHAHCYATEGYLYGYLATKNDSYKKIVERAARYLTASQAKDGGIFQYDQTGIRASDATAQAVRIWRSLDLINDQQEFAPSIGKALTYLERMLAGKQKWAVLYTRGRFGRRSPLAFTWVNMFTESALRLVESEEQLIDEIY